MVGFFAWIFLQMYFFQVFETVSEREDAGEGLVIPYCTVGEEVMRLERFRAVSSKRVGEKWVDGRWGDRGVSNQLNHSPALASHNMSHSPSSNIYVNRIRRYFPRYIS
jgi:hypothetical protein